MWEVRATNTIVEFFADFPEFFRTYVLEPLSGFGIIDIIDILILTLALFALYKFIRNRRAGKLALGLLLFMLVLVLSNILQLRAIGYLLQNFYQVGILAIIIVFQPELRAALEKVGNTSFISGIKNMASGDRRQYRAMLDASVNSICNAVAAMSKHKVGALIVIERTTKLGEYIGSGTRLDAKISDELIQNIFFKNAPLHDGAVIIRDFKVCAAGCFLRISEQEGLDSALGTRHRAALGVTEVSDAIVIVVSEETGKISLAVDGKLRRGLDREALRRDLVRLMTSVPAIVRKITDKEDSINE
ncbi:MAG: diadenylate cyclase CdaA [Clostridia bacterium]|nr:diadenylate cyclase CdaA [Clostridia bacterium]